jgi:glycine cleavage system aminomethyltransferase T
VEKALALALVDREAHGTEMSVVVRGKERPAHVTDLPFYGGGARRKSAR